jgi:hypothetical protein
MYSHLTDTFAYGLNITEISHLSGSEPGDDAGFRLRVFQFIQPTIKFVS